MLGSLPRSSTTFFTVLEMVVGKEVLGPCSEVWLTRLEGIVVVALMVKATTFSTTSLTVLLSPAVMLMAGPARTVEFTMSVEEMTGGGGVLVHPLVDGRGV